MRKRIRFAIAVLVAGLSTLANAHGGAGWEEAFFKANQAYQEGRFQEAIDGYQRLLRTGMDEGPVYYNLGNAYVKAGQLGQAIWAYERGRLLTPRDPDLRFNLSHARDQTRDAVENPRGSLETIFFWLTAFSPNELWGAFAVLNLLFWSLLAVRLFHRSEWLYYLLLVATSIWFVAGLSFGLKYYQVAADDRAVVLQKEVPALAGPDTADTVLFKLHEGTVLHHERTEDGWALIHVSDKNRGWVPAPTIRRISGEAAIRN